MVRKVSSGYFVPIREEMLQPMRNSNTKRLSTSTKPITCNDRFMEVVPEEYTQPYIHFMTQNPTTFHAVEAFSKQLSGAGYESLSERKQWDIKAGGKYYVNRNGSSIIAFAVGQDYKPGNGFGIVAGHVDALCAKLKPVSKLPTKAGYSQLAVAPYASGLGPTWWDRDLGVGGRVLVKTNGKVETRLVKLGWPIARIPTLAEHFGAPAAGPFNKETQMVPIIGLDNEDITGVPLQNIDIPAGTFAATQSPRLVKAIARELEIEYSEIVNWELELFDIMPATVGGIDKEFIFAGRIDDKLNCFSAIEGLLVSSDADSPGIVKMVGCFDDEEIGSLLRQGAKSNFMESVIDRIIECTASQTGANLKGQVLANSFLVSSDVSHAVNPNFLNVYLENHSPRLNIGITVAADSNGHMTTDSPSTALFSTIADRCGSKLQIFQIRNDSRSGGTIGPMTSSRLGCRAIDCGMAQLSMHSIRATIGSLDPGLGVKIYKGFFDHYEEVDKLFE